ENRLTRYFLRAIPGLDDYSLLGKAWWHTTETERGRPRWDTLVFDMPASGHSLSMLRIPNAILEAVPEGPLTRDARALRSLLRDRTRTAVVLVTLAEEMPANEARELTAALDQELGIDIAHLIINQVYPSRFDDGSLPARVLDALGQATGLASPDLGHPELPNSHGDLRRRELAALVSHSTLAHSRRHLNERYIAELERTLPVPNTQLPYLFVPSIGPDEIEVLSRTLEDCLG
ncbi:ArsA-related P-loop ATPase, partial [Haliangium sp.]